METDLGEAEGDQIVRRVSLGADGAESLCNPLVHHLQEQIDSIRNTPTLSQHAAEGLNTPLSDEYENRQRRPTWSVRNCHRRIAFMLPLRILFSGFPSGSIGSTRYTLKPFPSLILLT